MDTRTGLDGCEKSRPDRDSISGPSSPNDSLYRLRHSGPRGIVLHEFDRYDWVLTRFWIAIKIILLVTIMVKNSET